MRVSSLQNDVNVQIRQLACRAMCEPCYLYLVVFSLIGCTQRLWLPIVWPACRQCTPFGLSEGTKIEHVAHARALTPTHMCMHTHTHCTHVFTHTCT
jgi:hypothetical protein